MNRSATPPLFRTRHLLALGLGALLGLTVAAMPSHDDGAWLGFVTSLVFIASASASFVLFVLGPQRSPVRSQQVHGLLGLIAVGLLLSLQVVPLLA